MREFVKTFHICAISFDGETSGCYNKFERNLPVFDIVSAKSGLILFFVNHNVARRTYSMAATQDAQELFNSHDSAVAPLGLVVTEGAGN